MLLQLNMRRIPNLAALGWRSKALFALAISLAGSIAIEAQQAQPNQPSQNQPSPNQPQDLSQGQASPANVPQNNQPVQQLPPDTVRPNYVLGPNDQILVRAPEAEEIDNRP